MISDAQRCSTTVTRVHVTLVSKVQGDPRSGSCQAYGGPLGSEGSSRLCRARDALPFCNSCCPGLVVRPCSRKTTLVQGVNTHRSRREVRKQGGEQTSGQPSEALLEWCLSTPEQVTWTIEHDGKATGSLTARAAMRAQRVAEPKAVSSFSLRLHSESSTQTRERRRKVMTEMHRIVHQSPLVLEAWV